MVKESLWTRCGATLPENESGTPWRVIITPPAEKVMLKHPAWSRERIHAQLAMLENGPRGGGGKPLRGRPEWSLRIGGFRVLYRVDEANRVIVVTGIGSRGDVYKKH